MHNLLLVSDWTTDLGSFLAWTAPQGLWHLLIVDFLFRAVLVVVVLIRKASTPQTALTWVVLLVALPFLGIVLYLLIGESRMGYFRRKRHASALAAVDKPEFRACADPATNCQLNERDTQISALAEHVSDSPHVGGNRVSLHGNSAEFIRNLIADIDNAQASVHILYYIYLDDHAGQTVAEALVRAVNRGIPCRLLVDAVGSKSFIKSKLHHTLRAAGVKVGHALPVNTVRLLLSRIDLRNHRKIAVIDGQIGYTGSNNLAEAAFAPKAKFAPWVDCSVRIDGPAVKELQVLFLEDWYMETDEFLDDALTFRPTVHADGLPVQIIATGPNFYNEATTQLVQACLQVARREIVLTTPYFVPDQATITNLCVAARRGVETILVLPKNNDSRLVAAASRSSYRTLLEAGVELREFRDGLLHAKTISIDKDIAFVMSANLDRRSYELNFECGAIIYDTDFTSELRFLQQTYLEKSDRIDAIAWSNRPIHATLCDTAAGLLAPLL